MILSDEQQLLRQTALEFAKSELKPNSVKWSTNSTFPKEAVSKLASLGFLGMLIPEEYGGSDIGYVAYCLAMEEIARGDGATSTIIGVHNSVVCLPIYCFGNTSQKEKYLNKLTSGEQLGCFCLSEPQAGSDAKQLSTKATIENNEVILNGVKQFVTNGQQAKVAIVFAQTYVDGNNKGISAFIVPTETPGFKVARLEKKMGQRASEIAQIVLEDCKVPYDSLLGELGQGYKIALSQLEGGRLGVAAQAIGMAQAALDCALGYAQERETFGQPLIEHQAIAFKLAQMGTQIEAARQLTLHAAQLKEAGVRCLKQASMAKLFATEMAEEVSREAIQILGGYGYLEDYGVEQIYRDVRVTSIYEGTSDIQKMIIAREMIKE